MYFHTDSPTTLDWLARVVMLAEENYQSLRFDVDSQGRLKVKRGEGTWSSPIDSTPDPYRDPLVGQRLDYGTCQCHPDIHYFNEDCVGWRDTEPDTDDGTDCEDCGAANGAHFPNCVWMP